MALFTDGPASSIEDLTAQDSQVLTVANVEGIDLTQKLAVAQAELTVELQNMLARMVGRRGSYWPTASPSLQRVVVTPALRLWHTYRTLEAVYRDAHNNQLSDRYSGKREVYRERGQWAADQLAVSGLGLAADPAPRAAAPILGPAAGTLPDATYYVAVAWVNLAGQEGSCSEAASIVTTRSSFQARPGAAEPGMAGWHVYAGTAPDAMVRQNPRPMGQDAAWMQPGSLVTAGPTPSDGQTPTYFLAVPHLIQRG